LSEGLLALFEIDGKQFKTLIWAYSMQTLQFSFRGLLFLAVEVLKVLQYIVMLILTRLGLDVTIRRLIFEWN
jgi:hypothetical protein